jgi:UDP-N-acetylglucosamine transferase subunit ALG13
MIFVAVGSQLPFDRLIRTVDQWAAARGRSDVFAQIGASDFRPKHIEAARFLQPFEFRTRVKQAAMIVAHAGMGTIITALEVGKPIIVMPRRLDLNEIRTDHQVSTVKHLAKQTRVIVALDEQELIEKLDQMETSDAIEPINERASESLISAVQAFIKEGSHTTGRARDSKRTHGEYVNKNY